MPIWLQFVDASECFPKPNPFPKSIYDNVAYGVRLHYNPSRRELDRIVESALRRACPMGRGKRSTPRTGNEPSGGQQQRLCIARTIAVEPKSPWMSLVQHSIQLQQQKLKKFIRIEEALHSRHCYTFDVPSAAGAITRPSCILADWLVRQNFRHLW